MWFGLASHRDVERLREAFGELQTKLDRLTQAAPALSAALENAADKYARAAARWERSKARPALPEADDDDFYDRLSAARGYTVHQEGG